MIDGEDEEDDVEDDEDEDEYDNDNFEVGNDYRKNGKRMMKGDFCFFYGFAIIFRIPVVDTQLGLFVCSALGVYLVLCDR